ncbi:ATP synthase mitochondrial F1 complex assembly factor 1 [Kwoniella mangroviensis CBS 10435]|uniref:ATP synthase mitochondrial F1 complex assembly factor 1 n=1 Tax=Kwoniella mangroviensis CBS 10435 TaxID=1331196 RepID=A0A1B9IKZ9_9TREE|nr:ATP synthase mitochondrial F1 complex assembly factor 1 [Kwoniella mangroviensis CBS 10435]
MSATLTRLSIRSPIFNPRLSVSTIVQRSLCTTQIRRDVLSELENQLHPRELIERKRKEFEEKYGDKLNKKVKSEGVKDLDSLKLKVLAPSVKAALKAKKAKEAAAAEVHLEEEEKQFREDVKGQQSASEKLSDAVERRLKEREIKKRQGISASGENQAEGDRAGIKPLSSIINLPLIHLTPHDANAISQIWTAYHTSHPTLSNSFLSATLPTAVYKSMISIAKQNPFFVLPLPRLTEPTGETQEAKKGEVKTDEYEMFYLQWIFHPTSTASLPPSDATNPEPLPLTSSVIFTPLEEFKKQGEWAQPYLVLTHYPELSQSHDIVLMRGEISPASASGPIGSTTNPGFLLSQQQAQLLALALQRFYCTSIEPQNESEKQKQDRLSRASALVSFRERPEEWSWEGLVEKAYGGLV